ncbi:MAG: four helix bundle protein [Flavobacteriales bacterium]|nr:four helix bundle protein [Flavobacteriales bacterium]MCB9193221.1 four helix bundle protein [Flavobacteriales bacterium]
MDEEIRNWLVGEDAAGYAASRPNPVLEKSFVLALRVVPFTKRLRNEGWVDLARQLFRSATSVAANIHEAQHPSSRADFIHKMRLAEKEAGETRFWLKLCQEAPDLPNAEGLMNEVEEVRALLYTIIRSANSRR